MVWDGEIDLVKNVSKIFSKSEINYQTAVLSSEVSKQVMREEIFYNIFLSLKNNDCESYQLCNVVIYHLNSFSAKMLSYKIRKKNKYVIK